MVSKKVIILFLCCLVSCSLFSDDKSSDIEAESVETNDFRRNLFFVHTGVSIQHGFIGLEYQWHCISFNVGLTDQINGGLKIYVRRGLRNSFYFGAGYTAFDKYKLFGGGCGYRWIFKSGFTVNAGLYLSIIHQEVPIHERNYESKFVALTPAPSLTIGWAF